MDVLIAFRLLGKLLPARPLSDLTDRSFDELKQHYKSRDRLGNGFGFVAFVLLAVLFGAVLDAAAYVDYSTYRDAPYFIGPVRLEWYIFGAFLSLVSTGYLGLVVLRWNLDPDEYELYMAYGCHRSFPPAPFDIVRVMKWTFWIFSPLLMAMVVLCMDCYTAFTEKTVVDNPPFSLGTLVENRYDEVRDVYEIRGLHLRFEDKVQPYHLVVFDDGTRWKSPQGKGGRVLEYQRQAMKFVADRSGAEMQVVNFIEDVLAK